MLLWILVLVAASFDQRLFRFPFISAISVIVFYLLVVDLITSGHGNWFAFVSAVRRTPVLARRDCYRHAVVVLAPSRRRSTHRRALLKWFHTSNFDFALISIFAVVFVLVGYATKRSSWACLRDDRLLPRDHALPRRLADGARPRDLRDQPAVREYRGYGPELHVVRTAHQRLVVRRSRSASSASGSSSSGCSGSGARRPPACVTTVESHRAGRSSSARYPFAAWRSRSSPSGAGGMMRACSERRSSPSGPRRRSSSTPGADRPRGRQAPGWRISSQRSTATFATHRPGRSSSS